MSFNTKLMAPFIGILASAATFYVLSWINKKRESKLLRFDVAGRYSDAIKYNSLVFISGQCGEGFSSIEDQTRAALKSVDAALSKAGTDKSKILEATVWLADIERDYNGMNSVYDSWILPGKPPCRACIQAKLYAKDVLVEIRVIAAA